ncbi:hypothetical protein AURDEDRAFT_131308 [Auricularia subglabra TFB-10046 SS5]|uniref:Uncharacterized protein n=1 Tax=Auricularia subglabra (strain TFB-10046 / SS5) TaxID=717982 RepID=J0WP27_AURST|nr:hypothetical protein AURDEDRAFT_131308 [Auricularia subglabra TFB-10046 SS5]
MSNLLQLAAAAAFTRRVATVYTVWVTFEDKTAAEQLIARLGFTRSAASNSFARGPDEVRVIGLPARLWNQIPDGPVVGSVGFLAGREAQAEGVIVYTNRPMRMTVEKPPLLAVLWQQAEVAGSSHSLITAKTMQSQFRIPPLAELIPFSVRGASGAVHDPTRHLLADTPRTPFIAVISAPGHFGTGPTREQLAWSKFSVNLFPTLTNVPLMTHTLSRMQNLGSVSAHDAGGGDEAVMPPLVCRSNDEEHTDAGDEGDDDDMPALVSPSDSEDEDVYPDVY